jgi:hypothetical protein
MVRTVVVIIAVFMLAALLTGCFVIDKDRGPAPSSFQQEIRPGS